MNEFVDECRREWRRLGVPDPIANEMAADLTADIEEAESEGGTAEDVLGNSAFDPRRFAASWAGARGVTGPIVPDRSLRDWPVRVIGLTFGAAVLAMAAAALLVGRHSSAVFSVRRIMAVPKSSSLFASSPPFGLWHAQGVVVVAAILLLIGAAGLGLAALYWSPWNPSRLRSRFDGSRRARAR